MFGFGKKKASEETHTLKAAISGRLVPLADVPDEAFAEKMLGDGYAILPEHTLTADGTTQAELKIVAPCTGTIINVQDTRHAYGIETTDGIQILIHAGVNTVALRGEGFTAAVKTGDSVRAGDTLGTIDLAVIAEKGYAAHTVVLLTEMEKIGTINLLINDALVTAGETDILTYTKKGKTK